MNEINERVRQVMSELNITAAKLSEAIGITPSAVSQITNDKTTAQDKTLKAIAKEYGYNFVWLKTGEGAKINAESTKFPEKLETANQLNVILEDLKQEIVALRVENKHLNRENVALKEDLYLYKNVVINRIIAEGFDSENNGPKNKQIR